VSHLDTLKEGDLVISQGEGLIFPRGFGLGRVKSYELDGVQYHVTIEPLLDVSTLTFCLLLKSY
jgi:cell shape-determining protein MreC